MAKKPKYSRHFVKAWRKKRGLTQQALADRIGKTHPSVQRIENRHQQLTQTVLDDMALALRTTRGRLLDEPRATAIDAPALAHAVVHRGNRLCDPKAYGVGEDGQ